MTFDPPPLDGPRDGGGGGGGGAGSRGAAGGLGGGVDGAAHGSAQREQRFWSAVCLSLRQLDGMVAGYGARRADAERERAERGGVRTSFEGRAGASSGGRERRSGAGALPHMTYSDFLFIESNGDLYDIIDWMDPSQGPSW
jgi:hypothetical protein